MLSASPSGTSVSVASVSGSSPAVRPTPSSRTRRGRPRSARRSAGRRVPTRSPPTGTSARSPASRRRRPPGPGSRAGPRTPVGRPRGTPARTCPAVPARRPDSRLPPGPSPSAGSADHTRRPGQVLGVAHHRGRTGPQPRTRSLAPRQLGRGPREVRCEPGVVSFIKCRIEAFELDAGVVGSELSVDLGLEAVSGRLPGGDLVA